MQERKSHQVEAKNRTAKVVRDNKKNKESISEVIQPYLKNHQKAKQKIV